jgi:hypothetical protein
MFDIVIEIAPARDGEQDGVAKGKRSDLSDCKLTLGQISDVFEKITVLPTCTLLITIKIFQ